MANYYVDSVSGSNADNGTTQALAWATIEYAKESGGLSAGDKIWPRRGHTEIPTSDLVPIYSGSAGSPISVIGWPRAAIPNTTITSATWTNGSTTVDLVVGVTLASAAHIGRYVTAPNGKIFLITRIIDANTLIIDREYPGPTVTGTSGLFQIEADEDYSTRPTDVDGWDSDADTLAEIDFNSTAYQMYLQNIYYWHYKNMQFTNCADPSGIIRTGNSRAVAFTGCWIHTTSNVLLFAPTNAAVFLERVIITGSGAGAAQRGVSIPLNGFLSFKDGAVYNCGDWGFRTYGRIYLENVNIGVEVANGDDDIAVNNASQIWGREVKLGGTNGDVLLEGDFSFDIQVAFENYGKVLGDHKVWYVGGSYKNVDVGATNAPSIASSSGNTVDLLEILPTINRPNVPVWTFNMNIMEVDADNTSKTYTLYLQNNMSATLNSSDAKGDIWLVAEYVDAYNDVTAYCIGKIESAQTDILARADDTDWDSLTVTVQPAIASKVRLKLFISAYSATGGIYIDPLVVIS